MADWAEWWRHVRECIEQSETNEVAFSIDEIRAGAALRDQNLDQRWWWDMLMSPSKTSHTGLLENELECTQIPDDGPVERVVFRLKSS